MHHNVKQENTRAAERRNKADWDHIRETIKWLENRGADVINRPKRERTFSLPPRPGLRMLAAADCLINYGGFRRTYTDEEMSELMDLRHPRRPNFITGRVANKLLGLGIAL